MKSSIKVKEKKCKSTKTKGFGCGEMTLVRKLGLCQSCYPKWLYSTPEGQEAIRKQTIPLQKKRDDFKAAERDYEERKSLPALIKAAVEVFHEYIRTRDRGKNCVCCNTLYAPDHEAGHLYSGKQYPELRFNEFNVHGQSIQCNRFKHGNFEEYLIRVEERIGSEELARLKDIAANSKKELFKWDRSDLIRIRKHFTAKLALIKPKK